MERSTSLALLAAVRIFDEWVKALFTVVLRTLVFSHFCIDLPSVSWIELDEDRMCFMLKDDGFYLHSIEDSIYETH